MPPNCETIVDDFFDILFRILILRILIFSFFPDFCVI